MKSGSKHIIRIFSFILICSCANAQVSVRSNIDRDNILIGETLNLTVEAYVPIGANVTWFTTDTVPHFEILKKYGADTAQSTLHQGFQTICARSSASLNYRAPRGLCVRASRH